MISRHLVYAVDIVVAMEPSRENAHTTALTCRNQLWHSPLVWQISSPDLDRH